MNSIGCAPRQGPRQGPDRWDASSHSGKGKPACGCLSVIYGMLLGEHYRFFPWFDVIGILSGFAHYADVTDVLVACT